MATKSRDGGLAADSVRWLLKRYFDSQDSIKELLAFALSQGDALDGREAAAVRFSKLVLRSRTDASVAEKSYGAAEDFLLTQTIAFKEISKREVASIKDGQDPEEAREAALEEVEDTVVRLLHDLRTKLKRLGLSPEEMFEAQRFVSTQTRRPRLPVLMDSLLLTTVNDFENFFAGIAKASYTFQPAILKDSDRSYTWSDVTTFESIGEFTEYAIDDQVDRLMRDGLDQWIKFASRATRAKPEVLSRCAAPVAEVLQRRHVITHANGRVSRTYLERTKGMPEAGTRLNERLTVSEDYLGRALDRFALLALAIGVSALYAISQSSPDSAEDDSSFVDDLILDLLKSGRNECVAPLMEIISDKMSDASSLDILRVNSWIARCRIDGPESIAGEVRAWDDSNLDPRFQLAKLVLLQDFEVATSMCSRLLDQDHISAYEFETWPLLEPLRLEMSKEASAAPTKRRSTSPKPGASQKSASNADAPSTTVRRAAKKATAKSTSTAKPEANPPKNEAEALAGPASKRAAHNRAPSIATKRGRKVDSR